MKTSLAAPFLRFFQGWGYQHNSLQPTTVLRVRSLRNLRPVNPEDGLALILGKPPAHSGLAPFDPDVGLFGTIEAQQSPWAQRFEFLADLLALKSDPEHFDSLCTLTWQWTHAWLAQNTAIHQSLQAKLTRQLADRLRLTLQPEVKQQHPIVVARRVLNWLSHLIPIIKLAPETTQNLVLMQLQHDLRALIADQATDPIPKALFPSNRDRARWLRACAILGTDWAIQGLLPPVATALAASWVEGLVQNDGSFLGGDPNHTLSAGADLAMMGKSTTIQPAFARLKSALAMLQTAQGDLVGFGGGQKHAQLLSAILATSSSNKVVRPPNILQNAAIAKLNNQTFTALLSANPRDPKIGPSLHLEAFGETIFACFLSSENPNPDYSTAVSLQVDGPVNVAVTQVKRRDFDGIGQLEATRGLSLGQSRSEKTLTCVRTIRLEANGLTLLGEDSCFGSKIAASSAFNAICFVLGDGVLAQFVNDNSSVFITTPKQHILRFHAEGLDIIIKNGFVGDIGVGKQPCVLLVGSQSGAEHKGRDLNMSWRLEVEEFV